INNVKQIVEDDHIRNAREMFVEVDHPVIGPMVVNGNPIKLMDMMPRVNYPAPTLGQHNEEILKGFVGLSDEEFEALKANGTI
ncbi:MAG: CoA transferase, partial [Oscillospiraceae bacterium]|nr:CoA transferase [Oscillospiraceae bacterium]